MIKFILGISITMNILSIAAFFIIYKYSLKGIKNRIENIAINSFLNDSINLDMIGGFKKDDHK